MAKHLTQDHRHALQHLFREPRVGRHFADALDNKAVLLSGEARQDLVNLLGSPTAGRRIADAIDSHNATLSIGDRDLIRIAFADINLADRIIDSIHNL